MEIKRLFISNYFYAIILLAIILGLAGLYSYYMDISYFKINKQYDSITAYDAWLYCLGVGSGSILKVIFPLLISVPFCDSFLRDYKSGYINFIITRSIYKKYIYAKLISNGLAGILIMGVSLVSLLIICIILFPSNLPNTELNYKPSGVFSEIYKNAPIYYCFFLIIINMIFGLLYSLLGFVSGFLLKHRLSVIIFPFLFYLIIDMLSQLFHFNFLLPTKLIVPFETSAHMSDLFAGYIVIILMISFFIYQFKKNNLEEIF